MFLRPFFPHAEIRFKSHVEDIIPDVTHQVVILLAEAEAEPFFDQVAHLVHEQAEHIQLMVPPFVRDGFQRGRMHPGRHELAALVPHIRLDDRRLHEPPVVFLEDLQHEPETFHHAVIAAEILVRIGGVHDIPDPEHVVGIPHAVLGVIRAGHVAAVGPAHVFEIFVGELDAFLQRLPVESVVVFMNGHLMILPVQPPEDLRQKLFLP